MLAGAGCRIQLREERRWKDEIVGPVGFEPTTKGFTCPDVSAGSGLSLHPRTPVERAGGCGTLLPVIKGTTALR